MSLFYGDERYLDKAKNKKGGDEEFEEQLSAMVVAIEEYDNCCGYLLV